MPRLSPVKYCPSTAGVTERETMQDMKPDYEKSKKDAPKNRKQWVGLIVFDVAILVALALVIWLILRN